MTKTAKQPDPEEIQQPAIIRPDFQQTRELTTTAGGPKGWKRVSPLEAAYDRGQLAGGSQTYTAEARYEAGLAYSEIYCTAQASGRDSTDIDRVNKSGGSLPLSIAQAEAIRSLVTIDSHMSERDRKIVRMVCGDGYAASEAVRVVCGDYVHTVWARFREALDGLCEAGEKARRKPCRFAL